MKIFEEGKTYTNGLSTVTITKRVSNKGVRFNGRFYRPTYLQTTPTGIVEVVMLGSCLIRADQKSRNLSLWERIKSMFKIN